MRLQTMEIKIVVDLSFTIESFRFGDENEYKGWHLFLSFLAYSLK